MLSLARIQSQDVEVENRRVQRRRVSHLQGTRIPRIFDISRYGCQIETHDLNDWAKGQFVEIDFGSVVTRAIIRWSDRTRLGLEFTRPLGSVWIETLLAEAAPTRLRRL